MTSFLKKLALLIALVAVAALPSALSEEDAGSEARGEDQEAAILSELGAALARFENPKECAALLLPLVERSRWTVVEAEVRYWHARASQRAGDVTAAMNGYTAVLRLERRTQRARNARKRLSELVKANPKIAGDRSSPEAVWRSFIRLWRSGDVDAAYRCLSQPLRDEYSPADFKAILKRSARDIAPYEEANVVVETAAAGDRAKSIRLRPLKKNVRERAIPMREENGAWVFDMRD